MVLPSFVFDCPRRERSRNLRLTSLAANLDLLPMPDALPGTLPHHPAKCTAFLSTHDVLQVLSEANASFSDDLSRSLVMAIAGRQDDLHKTERRKLRKVLDTIGPVL